ncbi:MAG: hypothetical protein AABX11_06155 [Nanoarchaeota archaeon]
MVKVSDKGYDILGNIAIVKFDRKQKLGEKKKFALALMDERKMVTTVLEKVGKFSGRLRTLSTKWIAGEKSKEVIYRENGCFFRFNTDTCYFSPRLANERLEVAKMVKPGEEVLVLFGGVAPFAIVIAKESKAKRVVSVELGKDCSKYALENVKRNKLNNVEIIQGDVKRVLPLMHKKKERYDRIVMARPNLKDSFLDVSFPLIRKNGMIHYYGFCKEEELDGMLEMIKWEAKNAKIKIKIIGTRKAGDIGVRKFRYRVDVKVVN